MSKTKLDPKCCTGKMHAAVTNRGEYIPCCYVDSTLGRGDRALKKIFQTSVISKHNTIEDIVNGKEWRKLEKRLLDPNGPWPMTCVHHCKVRDEGEHIKKQTVFLTDGNKRDHSV
jgi:hypothetical protein